jgi:hypothetical protein
MKDSPKSNEKTRTPWVFCVWCVGNSVRAGMGGAPTVVCACNRMGKLLQKAESSVEESSGVQESKCARAAIKVSKHAIVACGEGVVSFFGCHAAGDLGAVKYGPSPYIWVPSPSCAGAGPLTRP